MEKVFLFLCGVLLLGFLSSCTKTERNLSATMHGIVSDNATGEPIANSGVVLSPGGKTKTTDADGAFEFTDLEPQQYTITVQKNGYSTNRKTATAVVGENAEVNITLTKQ